MYKSGVFANSSTVFNRMSVGCEQSCCGWHCQEQQQQQKTSMGMRLSKQLGTAPAWLGARHSEEEVGRQEDPPLSRVKRPPRLSPCRCSRRCDPAARRSHYSELPRRFSWRVRDPALTHARVSVSVAVQPQSRRSRPSLSRSDRQQLEHHGGYRDVTREAP